MKKQSGFTLIELIVVMVILGILAAVALPKFVDITAQARVAKLQGAFGAVTSAMAMTHASTLALSTATSATTTVSAEGTTINMVYGYPAFASIASAAGITNTGDYTITATASPVTIDVPGATTAANCRITYTEATAGVAATAVMVKTGC